MATAIQKPLPCRFQNVLPFASEERKTSESATKLAHEIMDVLRSGRPFKNEAEWKRNISVLSAGQLNEILKPVMQEIATLDKPIQLMQRLASILSLEQLQDAVRIEHSLHTDALETAKEMLTEARYVLQKKCEKASPPVRERLSDAVDSMLSILETILLAFGAGDFFEPTDSTYKKEMKSSRIFMLASFASLLTAMVGTTIGSSAIGWIVISIVGLSIIFPYIRPIPSYLPKGVNWTKQYRQGKLSPSDGRKKILDEIVHTIICSTKVKTHPMLVGPSGIGKTETAKAFVEAIERGDYPDLKGKRVFYFNCADLVKGSDFLQGENKTLSKINDEISRHRNDVILIFDEIHLTCQKHAGAFADQLKTLLDPGGMNFPNVIGITTEEEFYRDIYVNNAAFARRFKRINIENPDDDEMLAILTDAFFRQAHKQILENGALQILIKKTKEAFGENAPEPITAMKLLSSCIQRTSETQKSPLEKKAEQVRMNIQSLIAQQAAGHGKAILPYQRREAILHLEQELRKLEENLEMERKELGRFFQLRDQLAESKMATFKTVIKAAHLNQKALSPRDKNTLTSFLLCSHWLSPALQKRVLSEASRLGVKTAIDSALIDQVIQEELDNEKKARAATERGKQQIQEKTISK